MTCYTFFWVSWACIFLKLSQYPAKGSGWTGVRCTITLAVPGEGAHWENNCQQHRTTSHISNLPMPMPAPHLRRLSCPPPLVFHALPYRRRAPRNATAPTTTQPSPRLPFPSTTLHVAFVMVAGCRGSNKSFLAFSQLAQIVKQLPTY